MGGSFPLYFFLDILLDFFVVAFFFLAGVAGFFFFRGGVGSFGSFGSFDSFGLDASVSLLYLLFDYKNFSNNDGCFG